VSRRRFLGEASCAAVGSASLFSTLLNLRMTATAAAQGSGGDDDYKALVCLFFAGGWDSFNALVPAGDAEHAEYARIRTDLALPQSSLLPVEPVTPGDGRRYGVHPAMPEVAQLFDQRRLAWLSNVGTLVEPTTKVDMEAGRARLPLGLYSHADQIMHWQTSVPDSRTALGWGGRTADLLQSLNDPSDISMNISLSGDNVFQSGEHSVAYSIDPEGDGAIRIHEYGSEDDYGRLKTAAIDSLLDLRYRNLFQSTFTDLTRRAIDANAAFSEAIAGMPALQTTFATNEIARSFEMVARVIAARKALGVRRQTFFIFFGGWDHHDEVLNNMQGMLTVVSQSLGQFDAALQELGVGDQVTTFTASDFARTLTSNGRGSDHAWGGNHMVMGGAVRGGEIYGEYPQLYADNALDTGRGRLIPTTSCDAYFGELAQWFGVSPGDLDAVLPNIGRFHDTAAGRPPLGFMQPTVAMPTAIAATATGTPRPTETATPPPTPTPGSNGRIYLPQLRG
jgi:uncharacterized protein (DUF1501 family)